LTGIDPANLIRSVEDPTATGGGWRLTRVKTGRDRRILIRWLQTHARARPAARGGGRWRAAAGGGEVWDRVWGLDFVCGKHRGETRETPKPPRAARAARTQRRRRTTRRRNSGEPPSASRCVGMTTSGAGNLLTSLGDFGRSRRRGSDDGEERRHR
jgi:hypothetical protein